MTFLVFEILYHVLQCEKGTIQMKVSNKGILMITLQSMVKNGKQAMVLFSLSVTGMNQGFVVSNRQNRAQSETPVEPPEEVEMAKQESSEERKCCKCKPIDADTIDIYARAVFPFTFAVVNVIYWVAYTM